MIEIKNGSEIFVDGEYIADLCEFSQDGFYSDRYHTADAAVDCCISEIEYAECGEISDEVKNEIRESIYAIWEEREKQNRCDNLDDIPDEIEICGVMFHNVRKLAEWLYDIAQPQESTNLVWIGDINSTLEEIKNEDGNVGWSEWISDTESEGGGTFEVSQWWTKSHRPECYNYTTKRVWEIDEDGEIVQSTEEHFYF